MVHSSDDVAYLHLKKLTLEDKPAVTVLGSLIDGRKSGGDDDDEDGCFPEESLSVQLNSVEINGEHEQLVRNVQFAADVLQLVVLLSGVANVKRIGVVFSVLFCYNEFPPQTPTLNYQPHLVISSTMIHN